MNLMTDKLQATLHRGQIARLREAQGIEIRVTEGALWLTQERDTQDHVIVAGGTYRIDRPGVTLLTAFEGVCMEFVGCRAPGRSPQFAVAF
jgi:Protein of unknown function (DUF2917)